MKWRVLILLICWGVVGAAGRADGADDDGREIELDVNDVSFLWPPPRDRNDLASLISADDALADEDASFWPESAFKAVLEKAQNTAVVNSAGRENRISFRPFDEQFKVRANWKVDSVRIDPSAPGTAPMITKALGSIPQIRLVLQPVTLTDAGEVTVHDVAVHLVFNFVDRFEQPADGVGPARAIPDRFSR